jgi:hypothetical protein
VRITTRSDMDVLTVTRYKDNKTSLICDGFALQYGVNVIRIETAVTLITAGRHGHSNAVSSLPYSQVIAVQSLA